MRRLLTGLAITSLLFIARPAPAQAGDSVITCAIATATVNLFIVLDPAHPDQSFWQAGDLVFNYEGDGIDSLRRKRGRFTFEDKNGITLVPDLTKDREIVAKGAQLKGFISTDGSSFDLQLKDQTRKRNITFTPSTTEHICVNDVI